jgi:hypothetical protein
MAVDIDQPPIYDPLTQDGREISDTWGQWITVLFDVISAYLSQYGVFIPRVSTIQRDDVLSPVLGQMIYNTSIDAPQIFQVDGTHPNGTWKTFTTV